jgi:uncharacterized lipoprotein YddW (UPF0748 family)
MLKKFFLILGVVSFFLGVFPTKLFLLPSIAPYAYSKAEESIEMERHLRGVWISTVANLDWPSPKTADIKDDEERMRKTKEELLEILDRAVALHFNAVFLQVSPTADAIYPSDLVPWSRFLTGTFGKDPGFDPLAFAIEEAHKRNLKLHAWFNPYRVSMNTSKETTASLAIPKSIFKEKPSFIKTSMNRYVVDPGIPEVRDWTMARVWEVLEKYPVDGVHFDDYFYYENHFGELNDLETYRKYNQGQFASREDWRRNNTYLLIRALYEKIQKEKPHIQFGISPSGVWGNQGADKPDGSDTKAGFTNYDKSFADTKKWVEEELLDYIAPQIYFSFRNTAAPYETVANWWANLVRDKNVHLYIGQALYKVNDNSDTSFLGKNAITEIERQWLFNREKEEIQGTIVFRARNLMDQSKQEVLTHLKSKVLSAPALLPNMAWKAEYNPPKDVSLGTEEDFKKVEEKGLEGNPMHASLYFRDVTIAQDWAREAIDRLYERGVIRGDENGLFGPNRNMKRGDFVIMLVNAFGLEGEFEENFIDVRKDRYYYNHIGMAKKMEIIKGDGRSFFPEANINREDMMVMLHHATQTLGFEKEPMYAYGLSRYLDVDVISPYARDAILLFTNWGIVKGDSGFMKPKELATRAQAAVLLNRF